jgi:hypothetical protein
VAAIHQSRGDIHRESDDYGTEQKTLQPMHRRSLRLAICTSDIWNVMPSPAQIEKVHIISLFLLREIQVTVDTGTTKVPSIEFVA